jgi:chemotaxis protein methyltransferase CheR
VPTLHDDAFHRIRTLMHQAVGLSFADCKKPLVSSRLAQRISQLGLAEFDDYVELISGDGDGGEFQMAVDLLTTNETYFFREPAHFDLLAEEVTRARPRSLSVWSAAASFGDEAYSIAMLLADLQSQGSLGADWRILGTDISDRVLRSAVQATFPLERLRHVTPARMRSHCLRGEGAAEGLVRMHPRLHERVRFGQLNLCQPIEDLGPFDVIFLRNVMIYFDARTKAEVSDRVLGQLRPGGLFFIGTAEGRIGCRTPLQALGPGAFRKAVS